MGDTRYENFRRYGLVLAMVAGAAVLWYLLTPLTRYYFGFVYLLVIVFISGKHFGFGPSLFALLVGTIPAVALRLIVTEKGFDDSFSLAALAYYIIGAMFILLYRKQHIAYFALQKEVTQRKAVEEVIRISEARLQGILDNTTALIHLKDLDSRYLLVNRRWEQLFDIKREQFVGRTARDFFPSEIAAAWEINDRKVIETCQPIRVEEIAPHKDRNHTYLAVKFPIKDARGAVVAVGGISTDITDHKQTLATLEAEQELLRDTLEVQDHDRQLLAYEIHDGLVQYVAGALMQLEAVRTQIESESLVQRLDQVVVILKRTVDEGRRLIDGIRTPVLDDWGIVAAVRQLIEEEERAHVQVEFVKEGELGRMPPIVEEALYRITQEALTNIRKHSRCTRVRIALGRQGDRVQLEVRDWGVGFEPTNGTAKVHGLRGMGERAKIAGGQCTIQSAPGAGTQIVVDLPYRTRN
jgi:PAS domain S-box-containing protein